MYSFQNNTLPPFQPTPSLEPTLPTYNPSPDSKTAHIWRKLVVWAAAVEHIAVMLKHFLMFFFKDNPTTINKNYNNHK